MTDLEFRQQVLDTISPSFCAAKWYNATIWLGSGMTTSCHHPPAHLVDKDKVTANPRLLHNTDEKKHDRRKMLAGERPAGCEYCWKIEDMGRDAVSDRVYKSKIYPLEALHEARNTPADHDVDLRTLEIAFDRTCQFACSYCNPAFSTTWVNDIKRNGPYNKLVSDGRNHFTHTHDSSQKYKITEANPYVDAFLHGGRVIYIVHYRSSESQEASPSCPDTPGDSSTGSGITGAVVKLVLPSTQIWAHKRMFTA